VRLKIKEEKTPLRLYGKDFFSPTGKTILEQFDQVVVMEYEHPTTGKREKIAKIPEKTKLLLRWLGLDEKIFLERKAPG